MPPHAGPPQIQHAVVKVPDPRLETLAVVYKPKKITEADIEFIDVPGFSLAEPHGKDLLRKFLPDMRQSDMLLAVIRAFDDPAVPPYRNRVDPGADFKEIADELLFADFDTISNRIEKVEKNLKKPTKTHTEDQHELTVLTRCRATLENSDPLTAILHDEAELRLVQSFGLLTVKPLLVVYNVSEGQAGAQDPPTPRGAAAAVNVCAQAEWDIAQLDASDRPAFLAEIGVEQPARDRLIRKCYEGLGLISFLTTGEQEVRAWPVTRGTTAVEAAGNVHTDMARGFIRAETVAYDDFVAAGDMKSARSAGHVRQEGKTYVVKDGDIILFKFNV